LGRGRVSKLYLRRPLEIFIAPNIRDRSEGLQEATLARTQQRRRENFAVLRLAASPVRGRTRLERLNQGFIDVSGD